MNKKNTVYINPILVLSLALSLWILPGCNFKNELCYLDHPHSNRLSIEPDWGTLSSGEIPDRLRMLIYQNDNRHLWLDTVVESDQPVSLNLEQNYYMILLFNEDIGPMILNQPEDYFNAYLQLPALETETVKSSSSSSLFASVYRSMRQPGLIYTGTALLDYRKVLPNRLSIPVQRRTKTLLIHINLLNNEIVNVESCNGILSGLASAFRLYRAEAIKGNPGFVEFPFSPDQTAGTLNSTVFFLDADTEESRYSNLVQMTFQLRNGQTVTRSADITQWLSEQLNSGKDRFDLSLNVSLESDQSGGIIIDDSWGDDIVVPID